MYHICEKTFFKTKSTDPTFKCIPSRGGIDSIEEPDRFGRLFNGHKQTTTDSGENHTNDVSPQEGTSRCTMRFACTNARASRSCRKTRCVNPRSNGPCFLMYLAFRLIRCNHLDCCVVLLKRGFPSITPKLSKSAIMWRLMRFVVP